MGPAAVKEALIEAAVDVLVNERLDGGTVREIARRANVNHGLVHTYFHSKDRLLSAAFDQIQERARAELRPDGFPPPDLAQRRNGELAKVMARMSLDTEDESDLFGSHPVTSSWLAALRAVRPEADDRELAAMVAASAAMGLGWALFGPFLCRVLAIDEGEISQIDAEIQQWVAHIGGIPEEGGDQRREPA